MNYSLTFKSDYGNTREIATIKPLDKSGQIKSDNEILQEALALINAFCEDRSF